MELNRITAEGRNTQEAKFFHDRDLRIPNPYVHSVHNKSKSSLEKPLVPQLPPVIAQTQYDKKWNFKSFARDGVTTPEITTNPRDQNRTQMSLTLFNASLNKDEEVYGKWDKRKGSIGDQQTD